MKKLIDSASQTEVSRYIINGLIATTVHFCILTFNLEIIGLQSAGLANAIAACFGITASFLGSRYYVFKKNDVHIAGQAMMFIVLYGSIACLHGLILYVWTDINKFDYRIGFIVATFLQVTFSYFGNKFIVFKK